MSNNTVLDPKSGPDREWAAHIEASPTVRSDAGEKQIRAQSRRAFLQQGLVVAGGLTGLWAFNKYSGEKDGANANLRRVLDFNDRVAESLFFSPNHRATEYPKEWAREPRNNYKGETPEIDLEAWRLHVTGNDKPKQLTLADLQKMPQVEQTTELKCVEGWSTIVNWGGVRFVDFAEKYPPAPGTTFVSMLSEPADFPDEQYYVGLDLASCLHPQTLLATHMNGKPLNSEHGAPLRLVMPHKYGIKNIKLITTIAYATDPPADYWHEQGYDYYAGL